MLELLTLLGFRLAEADSDDTQPPGPHDRDGGRLPHPTLDRPSDAVLFAELLPSHAPEFC